MCNSKLKLYVWKLSSQNSWSFGTGIVVAKNKEEAYSLLMAQAEVNDITWSPTATENRELVSISKDDVKEIELNENYVQLEMYSV